MPRVLLVDETGEKLGVFQTFDAIQMAKDKGLDLIEVAPNARPPVCKIGDFGKMRYELSKKQAAARRRQHRVQVKEIKVRPKTDDHDMDVKTRAARKFLEEGNKVKVTVWFRGREHAHHEIGAEQCLRLAESVKEHGAVESPPKMEGRNMIMILAPTDPPKVVDAPKEAPPKAASEAPPKAPAEAPAAEIEAPKVTT